MRREHGERSILIGQARRLLSKRNVGLGPKVGLDLNVGEVAVHVQRPLGMCDLRDG